MNCRESYEPEAEADIATPGIIFTDVNEILYTLTHAEQKAVVDRILDFKMVAAEPPVAAQFLCNKLYEEFAVPPAASESELSSVKFAPEVVACATTLVDNGYEIKAALRHVLEVGLHAVVKPLRRPFTAAEFNSFYR
eukprot:5596465-Pyramimonas_sp.AAC.1